jgi:hypothetical protein
MNKMVGKRIYCVQIKAASWPGATRYLHRYDVAAGSPAIAGRRVVALARKDKLISPTIQQITLLCTLDG